MKETVERLEEFKAKSYWLVFRLIISYKCLQVFYFPLEKDVEIELAILWKMEMQYYGKTFCNFYEKSLAKNTLCYDPLLHPAQHGQLPRPGMV